MDKAIEAPVNLAQLLGSRCAYCGGPAQGNHAIHRDGFGERELVDATDLQSHARTLLAVVREGEG